MIREVRVMGVGSPHGDDQAGWRLVDSLLGQYDWTTDPIAISDPLDIVQHLDGRAPAVIIDACVSGGSVGSVTRIQWPTTRLAVRPGRSSHSLSVADALELAQRLGRLPRRVVIFGIEVGRCRPGDELSLAVQRALPALGQRVIEEVRHLERLPEPLLLECTRLERENQ